MSVKRLQFDFTPEQLTLLEETKTALNAPTYVDVIRRALTLMHHIAKIQARDGVVEIITNNQRYQLIMY